MALVKFGVPIDTAFSFDRAWRIASLVVFGEMEGGVFDWPTMQWQKRT